MKILRIFISIFVVVMCFHCASVKNDSEITLKDKITSGLDNLERERYIQAQADFKYVLIRGTGTDLGDDAQYYLGEAFFRNEEYLLAIAEYEKLTRRMGFSPFVEDARFKICEAYRIESPKYYHDQQYTEKALDRYQEFLDDYPNSKFNDEVLSSITILREKLGKKVYETGVLYIKMEEYESAKISFQTVIDQYYDTKIVFLAQQGMIKALVKNNETTEAISLLNEFKTQLQENGLFEQLDQIIKSKKKKNAVEEG